MARLNEPPAPALESIETLKRRFIRQNREIARVNSNQSVRIRNLEIEISRLLAENILLREEAINAKIEAEKWMSTQRLSKEVSRMKEQLEGKLSEVNALVEELGNLPEKVARRSSEKRRRSIQASDLIRRKSGEEREIRHRLTLSEHEGRLPAILEDKYYPRRTLEAVQIHGLLNEVQDDALESPELGPPPVAHFDEHEIVTFDAGRSPRRTSTELVEEIERTGKTSAENRRKRRTSALLQPSSFEAGVDADAETATRSLTNTTTFDSPQKNEQSILKKSSRVGSKRKLEMSELEDTSQISKEVDDFIFQRKAITIKPPPRPSRFSRPPGRQSQENIEPLALASPDKSALPIRRALAPKSTNSPAKRKVSSASEKPLPETPAAELGEFTSPPSADPSTAKQWPAQEMTVTNSVEDVLNGSIGRGSRRARAAVSYAEPNLRDKMRRPGKALVGAVEGLAKPSADIEKKTESAENTDIQNGGADGTSGAGDKMQSGQTDFVRWSKIENSLNKSGEPVSPLGHRKMSLSRINSTTSASQENKSTRAVPDLSVFDSPTSSPDVDIQHTADSESLSAPILDRHPSRYAQTSGMGTSSSRVISRRTETISSTHRPEKTQIADARKLGLKKAASATALPNFNQLSTNRIDGKPHVRTGSASASVETPSTTGMQSEQPSRASPLTRRRSMMV